MVERAGGPLCLPEPGDPTVCRAWPGFGTTFSNLLSNVSPSVVDDGGEGGFNGADNLQEASLSGRIRKFRIYPPHAHPGRISGPHKRGEGRAPARTVRGRGSGPADA
jgi:hypothetical protein